MLCWPPRRGTNKYRVNVHLTSYFCPYRRTFTTMLLAFGLGTDSVFSDSTILATCFVVCDSLGRVTVGLINRLNLAITNSTTAQLRVVM
jgi:hypothetical protein